MRLGETQPFASPAEAIEHHFDKKVEEIKEGRTDEELARLGALGREYLQHYGVKGMRWGVRKERETSGRESGKGQVGVDPVTVAVVTMYAAMAAKTALFAYRYSKDGGEKIAEKNKDVPWKKNPDLAKKMDVNGLEKNVVKQVNPDFPKAGTKMNCRRCTLAYEMRRRGYDVTATKSRYAKGQDDIGLREALGDKNKKYDSVWGEKQIDTPDGIARADSLTRGKKIFDALDMQPEGARGELGVGWFPMGGHSVAWEKVNGKAVIFDTQSGKTYRNPRDFKELSDMIHDAAYTRTDNKQINDQFIRRWAVNA